MAKAQEELNKERDKELRLIHEEKILRLTGKEMVESLGTEPEKYAAEAEHQPTADIINRLRETQVHILQVQRTSGNLKGSHQGALKVNASLTLGLIEALRTRIDENTEVEILRKKQEEQEESFKKMEEELKKMREIINIVQLTTETERRKAEHYQKLLQREKEKKEDLERQLQLAREEWRLGCWEPEPEPIGRSGRLRKRGFQQQSQTRRK